MLIDPVIELLRTEEERLGWQGGSLGVTLYQAVTLARVLPEMLKNRFQIAMQHDRRSTAEIIENGSGFLKEQRQVVFDACGGNTMANILVNPALGRVAIEELTPATAKARPGRLIHREFPARQQAHLRHRVQAALTVRIKGTNAVDFIVEQVNPVGNR